MMKYLLKTQVLAVAFSLLWVLDLILLAFFNQPGRAMQHINLFVYGFAILLAIIYFITTKYVIGSNWRAVPLVLIPYFLLYQPGFERILLSLVNKGYGMTIKFLSLSTGSIHFITLIFGVVFGIIFSKRHQKV